MLDVLSSFYLLSSALLSLVIAQTIKIILFVFTKRSHVSLRSLFTTGGMPSTHSAWVTGLCGALAWQYGIHSPYVAISVVFAGIVIYDSVGLRQAVGKQATIINKLSQTYPTQSKFSESSALKELIGHTPLEAIVGMSIGALISSLVFWMI